MLSNLDTALAELRHHTQQGVVELEKEIRGDLSRRTHSTLPLSSSAGAAESVGKASEDSDDANAQASTGQDGQHPAEVWQAAIPKHQLVELVREFAAKFPARIKQKACVRLCRQYIIETRKLFSWEQLHGADVTKVVQLTLESCQ